MAASSARASAEAWPTAPFALPDGSVSSPGKTLETLSFDNRSLRELPLDLEKENYVRTVRNACFSRVMPSPVDRPVVVSVSLPALRLLDIGPDQVARPDFAEYFAGNNVLPGAEPAAHCYCGHQFGAFSGQLGDGATMYLGEVVNNKGERWELQFKGAGKTPYSRTADGELDCCWPCFAVHVAAE